MALPPRVLTLLLLLLAAAGAVLSAQCQGPPTPAGGFPLTVATDLLVTYTDAYRTRADVRYPAAAAGSCGWPLLIAVHGFLGSKSGPVAAAAATLAARGYLVVTYDVRGQGSGIALNPGRGTTLMALNEWIDMFEIMEWAAATHPGLADLGRAGVFGISQGGAHSWAAAAWSGRIPPPNPRRSAPFPVVRAAAPTVMVPSHSDAGTLDGTAFVNSWATLAFVPPNSAVVLDAAFQATMRSYLLAGDPAGFRAWMLADPGRDFQHLLPTSTTATLASMAWLDETMAANRSVQALAQMPAATPKRAVLTTGLHGTPSNTYESARGDVLREAWFERFLKGGLEPVELGPPVLSACLPANRTEYLAASTLWRHRADEAFTPATAVPLTYHLRQGASLATPAPAGAETAEPVLHNVPAGYSLTTWRADGAGQNVPLALSRIPLSSHSYTTVPFAAATEIAGIPVLHLEVTPFQPDFLLAARLEAVPPAGTPQVLSQGGLGVHQGAAPAPAQVTIELSATACVLPAGSRLRLSVRNHYLVMAAATESFRYTPFFTTSRVDIEHRPGAASRLVLLLRAEPRLDASTTSTAIALATPAPVMLSMRSSAGAAGAPFWILASLSGQGPAFPLPGGSLLYLQPDPVTYALLGVTGTPLLPGLAGVLDAAGNGSATLDLGPLAPLPAFLSGWNAHLAPIAIRGAIVEAGAPLELTFP